MKASINVVCYKWKVLANGECPLMLRVANGKAAVVCPPMASFIDPLRQNMIDPLRQNKNDP